MTDPHDKLRVVIVDDQEVARRQLKLHLEKMQELELIGEAKNGLDGVELINRMSPDLAFLDVEMPDISGLDLLPHLKAKPIIIFCTSHNHYAFQAFEAAALDYIQKPVDPQRLSKAISRAREQYSKNANWPQNNGWVQKVISQDGNKVHVVWIKDIALFKKEGRYTQALLETGESRLTTLSLDSLEELLNPDDFFRINRKTIIRRSWITGFQPGPAATGRLQLANSEEETISRSRWKLFKAWFLSQ